MQVIFRAFFFNLLKTTEIEDDGSLTATIQDGQSIDLETQRDEFLEKMKMIENASANFERAEALFDVIFYRLYDDILVQKIVLDRLFNENLIFSIMLEYLKVTSDCLKEKLGKIKHQLNEIFSSLSHQTLENKCLNSDAHQETESFQKTRDERDEKKVLDDASCDRITTFILKHLNDIQSLFLNYRDELINDGKFAQISQLERKGIHIGIYLFTYLSDFLQTCFTNFEIRFNFMEKSAFKVRLLEKSSLLNHYLNSEEEFFFTKHEIDMFNEKIFATYDGGRTIGIEKEKTIHDTSLENKSIEIFFYLLQDLKYVFTIEEHFHFLTQEVRNSLHFPDVLILDINELLPFFYDRDVQNHTQWILFCLKFISASILFLLKCKMSFCNLKLFRLINIFLRIYPFFRDFGLS